jgi:predicted TIM-barrel fold metal-dependent hydrolase
MGRKYRIISSDSHLEIAPERWTPRLSKQYRDIAPRLVRLPEGGDGIIIENRKPAVAGLALTGRPYQEHSPRGVAYAGTPGTGSPEQRLQEQDQDGVDAEVLFMPSQCGPTTWRSIKDDGAYKAMVRAWNEFLGQEYCAADPARLIGLGFIPDTGLSDAMAELEYCSRAGLRGVILDAYPSGKGYPSPEDDRFWQAALDLNMALTVHVALRSPKIRNDPSFIYPRDPGPLDHGGSDLIRLLTQYGALCGGSNATQMVLSGLFDRFPELRIFFAENQLSWIPHFLEQLDDRYERNRYWAERLLGLEPLSRPSECIRQHCWWGFLRNPLGVRLRHEIGVDRVMWGNDFPHAVGDWPNSRRVIEENFQGVPEEERYLMAVGNAVEFFHLNKV